MLIKSFVLRERERETKKKKKISVMCVCACVNETSLKTFIHILDMFDMKRTFYKKFGKASASVVFILSFITANL